MIYEKIKTLNITLVAPAPAGLYTPVKTVGSLVYTSGIIPVTAGKSLYTGKVGAEVSLEQAQEAAKLCVANILGALDAHLGDLRKIKQIVKVTGFVQSATGFNQQANVMNAASQLLCDIFGDKGVHTRSAVGVYELPLNVPVEIELIAEI
ncbi:MAG: RidA family protein [Deferribacteraceae bacterium]|jgi:enamine deaminase RidA (YjgF/YER057c/UK114 family)|nr:RidA family protein [Deferribacteraceae bacterium]